MANVSMIMPAKDCASTLMESIQSLIEQVYTDWELIIVCSESRDNTFEIATKASSLDQRIVAILDTSPGRIAAACNRGLEKATGNFVAVCNADDIYMENHLLAQLQFFKLNPEIGVVGTCVQTFGDQVNFWRMPHEHNIIKATMLFRGSIANPTAMIRREVLEKNCIKYDLDFESGTEDLDLWERLSNVTKMANLDFATVKYRISNLQATRVNLEDSYLNVQKITLRILDKLGYKPTTNEIRLHDRIVRNTYDIDPKDAEEYFNALLAANEITKHFDRGAFKRVIEKEKFLILERNLSFSEETRINRSRIIRYFSSKLPLKYKIQIVNLLRSGL